MASSSGRTALITGGTTGIGLATARVFYEEGYNVIVTGRNPRTLEEARLSLPKSVSVFAADARSLADADKVAAEVKSRFGKLDVVFLNAGVGLMRPLEAMDESAYDDLFAVNVKGQYFTLQKVLPLIAEGGSVILNASVVAHKGMPNWSAYAATKGAIVSVVRALALELAPRKIRVNSVSPGPFDTPALGKVGIPADALPEFRKNVPSMVALGRFGDEREVAQTVAFLASPAAGYITGADLTVDGGMRAA
jgi:NAD(P)-dependent dehydrogenase (short-subunit alcohol dehydrogenase family)